MPLARAAAVMAVLVACALAALGDAPTPSVVRVFVPGKTFGLGEIHVYVIERSEAIAVRYRDEAGELVTKNVNRAELRSLAFTVEGYGQGGSAVVAIATTDGLAGRASRSSSAQPPAYIGPEQSSPSIGTSEIGAPSQFPSPSVGADGSVAAAGPLHDLALTWLALDGLDQPLGDGVRWKGGGDLSLPLGKLRAHLSNAATAWNGSPNVVLIASNGGADVTGRVRVPGLGDTALRGSAAVTGQSYLDVQHQLSLGATYAVDGRGNASGPHGEPGLYTLSARTTLKLVRYVAGLSPPAYEPFPSGPVGLSRNAETSKDLIRPAASSDLTRPAATDNVFSETPLPGASPTPGPDVELAPVPLPIASDAPFASPPAPPPTPMPTRTPR